MKFLFVLIFTFILCNQIQAQADSLVTFTERPYNLQLFTRDSTDSAMVSFKGVVKKAGYEQISMTMFKNGMEESVKKIDLVYSGETADFELLGKIHAELAEYNFKIDLWIDDLSTTILEVDSVVCGDAYIINGQSNSHYAWEDADFRNEYCRTFGVKTGSSNYFDYDPADTLWNLAQGSSMIGTGVGTLGIYIQKYILEEYGIPTAIFNGGTGGSIISEHQPDPNDRMDLTTIYGKLLYRISKSRVDDIKGIIWHQGENDSDPDKVNTYPGYFNDLYQAWKTDYDPQKVYLFQIHPGCGGIAQSRFRELQRTLADFLEIDNLDVMSTVGIPGHDGCHYSHEGYRVMADLIYRLLRVDFYGSDDTDEIYPPNIREAIYDRYKERVILVFDNTQSLIWPDDTLGFSIKDYFYFDGEYGVLKSGTANKDSVILQLNGPNFFDKITYLPDINYNDNSGTYEGPWIRNSRGVGALSFDNVTIEKSDTTIKVISPDGGEIWNPLTQQIIEWESTNVSLVNILFSSDNGSTWSLLAENLDATQGSYEWTTADVISSECKIKIAAVSDSSIADESNHVFGIFAKTLQVTSPDGGENWPVGSSQNITWDSEFVNRIRIEYSSDSGANWNTVKRVINAEPAQVEWIIPDDVSEQCLVKIIDAEETTLSDQSDAVFSIVPATAIKSNKQNIPDHFNLAQNQPNPFNPQTVISYQLANTTFVRLTVYDVTGREITVLVNRQQAAGNYNVMFDALKFGLGSGVYLYKIETPEFKQVRKMILTK